MSGFYLVILTWLGMVLNRGVGGMTGLFSVVGTADLSFLKSHLEGLVG